MTPIDRLCQLYPNVPKSVIKAVVRGGWNALRARLTHAKKSPHRAILVRGLGKFWVATEATHRKNRKMKKKYAAKYRRTTLKKKKLKINMQDINWLLKRQR